ncbi:MAG: hypothetical protein LGB58_01645 [Sulfurovum sp.]|nr:hypothetical protein [Sulfurovum sp.]
MVICSSIKIKNQLREIFIKKVIGLLLFFIATQAYTSEVSIQFTPNDHGNSRNTATPINPNSITHGRIERARDSDYFKIVIPRGGGTLRGTVVSCSPRKNLFFPSRKPKSTLLWR